MCNKIHHNSFPIKGYGYGYKIIDVTDAGTLMPCFNYYHHHIYLKEICGWINWNERKVKPHSENIGFCLFKELYDARVVLRKVSHNAVGSNLKTMIFRVQYAEGICLNMEDSILSKGRVFPTILAKSFRLLERIK